MYGLLLLLETLNSQDLSEFLVQVYQGGKDREEEALALLAHATLAVFLRDGAGEITLSKVVKSRKIGAVNTTRIQFPMESMIVGMVKTCDRLREFGLPVLLQHCLPGLDLDLEESARARHGRGSEPLLPFLTCDILSKKTTGSLEVLDLRGLRVTPGLPRVLASCRNLISLALPHQASGDADLVRTVLEECPRLQHLGGISRCIDFNSNSEVQVFVFLQQL